MVTWDEADALFGVPFVRGVADCCTLACDHVLACHGVDLMAEYRNAYHDDAGAEQIIRKAGGWLCLWDHLCAQAGMRRCDGWDGAVIGLARVEHGRALVLPLEGGRWAGKAAGDGYCVVEEVRAAWAF